MAGLKMGALVMVLAASSLTAQEGTVKTTAPAVPPSVTHGMGDNGIDPAVQERLDRGRQNERQRRLMADTDRLLALATELKAEMDKTTKNTLSLDVIKKAEEIEKLARSVKERMRS